MGKAWLLAFMALASGAFVSGAQENASSWSWAGWGGGGFFWSSAADPSDPNVLYLGGDVLGVYKSVDKGRSWSIVNNGLCGYGVYSLAVAKSSPKTVFAMTTVGICKSVDGAASWKALEATRKGKLDIFSTRDVSVRAIAVDPSNSEIVYAGSKAGRLFKSSDGGETWSKLLDNAAAPVSFISIPEKSPSTIFVSTLGGGLLKSEDAGASWRTLDTPKQAVCAKAAPSNKDIVYASFKDGGMMKSLDGGASWSSAKEGMAPKLVVRDIVVHPSNPDRVNCVARDGWSSCAYLSEDGGRTWSKSDLLKADRVGSPTLPEEWKGELKDGHVKFSGGTSMALSDADPDTIFISANWRNIISRDGGRTWEESSKGADISCIHDLFFLKGSVYAVAMDEGLLKSEDSGASWKQLVPLKYIPEISGHQWRVFASERNGSERIVSTCSPWNAKPDSNRVLLSSDGGKSFEIVKAGLPDYVPNVNCMWGRSYARALAVDPVDSDVMYLGMDGDPEPEKGKSGGGVFKSVDGGKTWAQLASQPGSRRFFYGLAVDPADGKRLYAGTCGQGGGVYLSEDGGTSWSKSNLADSWIFNLVAGTDGLLLAGGNDLWLSPDKGRTWRKGGCPGKGAVVGIALDPAKPSRIFASRVTWGEEAEGGVYMSEDSGASWKEITGDIPCKKPLILRYSKERGELWAAGPGIYRLKI